MMVRIIAAALLLGSHVTYTSFESDRAAWHAQQGQWQEGHDLLETAVTENPENPQLLYDLGVASHQLGNLPEACAYFSQAAEHAQTSDTMRQQALYNHAHTCAQLGKVDEAGQRILNDDEMALLKEAVTSYEQVLELDPHNERAQNDLPIVKEVIEQQKKKQEEQEQQKQQEQPQQQQQQEQDRQNQSEQSQQQQCGGSQGSNNDSANQKERQNNAGDQQQGQGNDQQNDNPDKGSQSGQQGDSGDNQSQSQGGQEKEQSGEKSAQGDSSNKRSMSSSQGDQQNQDRQADENSSAQETAGQNEDSSTGNKERTSGSGRDHQQAEREKQQHKHQGQGQDQADQQADPKEHGDQGENISDHGDQQEKLAQKNLDKKTCPQPSDQTRKGQEREQKLNAAQMAVATDEEHEDKPIKNIRAALLLKRCEEADKQAHKQYVKAAVGKTEGHDGQNCW